MGALWLTLVNTALVEHSEVRSSPFADYEVDTLLY
jgi:hypothetical protein